MDIYKDRDRLNELTDCACEVIDDILTEFEVEYRNNNRYIQGICPIHCGDNPTAFILYSNNNNDRPKGIWRCWTQHCEKFWGKNIIGLVHGLLSRDKTQSIPRIDAIDWLCKFLGYNSLHDIEKPDAQTLAKRHFANSQHHLRLLPTQIKTSWNRYAIREQLIIPSQYYIQQGFSHQILNKYDVGFSLKTQRIVVPVYDDEYRFAIGFTSRSIHPQCIKCKMWHKPSQICPNTEIEYRNASKWKHSDKFNACSCLYNYWFAKKHIQESSTAILVEGTSDVWKLEECGIHNSVGLFGAGLTEEQSILLEQLGVMSVIVLLDNDEAGYTATQEIREQLHRCCRLYFPTFIGNDIGNLQNDAITSDIKPIIDKAMKLYSEVQKNE